jgi:hypothetical protein
VAGVWGVVVVAQALTGQQQVQGRLNYQTSRGCRKNGMILLGMAYPSLRLN